VFKPAPILGHKELTGNRRLAPPPAANNRGRHFSSRPGVFKELRCVFPPSRGTLEQSERGGDSDALDGLALAPLFAKRIVAPLAGRASPSAL